MEVLVCLSFLRPVVPAPRRSCAPSFLRPVVPAPRRFCAPSFLMASLLLAFLLLAAPESHAGTYAWTTRDANGAIIAESPSYTGGTIAITPTPTGTPPAFGTDYDYYGLSTAGAAKTPMSGNSNTTCNVQIDQGATITATLTWQPDSGQTMTTDPPPSSAILWQYGNDSGGVTSQQGTGSGSGTADCGLPGEVNMTSTSAPNCTSTSSSMTCYSAQATAGASFQVTCKPIASFTGSAGTQGVVNGSAKVEYSVIAYPVTLTLSGTTPDSSGNQNILVGQSCTATLNGIPSGCTASNFRWAVSGTTFESWTVSSDQSHTTEVDAIPATNPTQWCWNDLQAATETVKCTFTVTPATGEGSPFDMTVTALKPVSVQVPAWSASGAGGYMEVNTGAPGQSGYALYAGPLSGQQGGINFTATSNTPPLFGKGSLELVQLVTPNMSYVVYTGTGAPGPTHSDPENGINGLDTHYPKTGPSYSEGSLPYITYDDPSMSLSSSIASAQMQHQFTDYLMYQPPGSSQWVPLGIFNWSTNGSATVPFTDNWADYAVLNGSLAAGTVSPANQTFTAGNTFPSWTRIDVFPSF